KNDQHDPNREKQRGKNFVEIHHRRAIPDQRQGRGYCIAGGPTMGAEDGVGTRPRRVGNRRALRMKNVSF
ncbi:MAG: hypothetical protein NW202_01915, partial [Nitrospira sp.]|nr:hypothetical protein [Nitrospira sp.]